MIEKNYKTTSFKMTQVHF